MINLFVIGLGTLALLNSRIQYEQRAAIATQNLSQALEQYLADAIGKIDLALLDVADEVTRQRASGGIDTKTMNAYIARIFARLPYLEVLRMANEQGEIICGADTGARAAKPSNYVADRDYFKRLRSYSNAGLVISKPVIGRISGKWVVIFARRLNKSDGSFAGATWAAIELGHFNKTFAKLDVGRNGVISLRDSEMSLIARHPVLKGRDDSVGQSKVSQELIEQVKRGADSGTYYTPTGSDNIARTVSFRKIGSYPLYIIVGLATSEYLVEWKKEVAKISMLTAFFVLITALSSWLLYRDAAKLKLTEIALRKSEKDLRDMTSALGEGIYVLNIRGDVTFMNPEAERLLGWTIAELADLNMHDTIHSEKEDGTHLSFEDCPMHKITITGEKYSSEDELFKRKDGTKFPVAVISTPIVGEDGTQSSITAFRDITIPKELQKEKEKLISELQNALAKVKILSGMLPICASCKKIRNDEGYWTQIEAYIKEHSEAEFTHAICPDCGKKLYPEYYDKIWGKEDK
ncbi:MAG: PAS domain S-box protein [Nitrospirae bacterium]|nr:PAS domain S-box protein [Nitrospirota bacterium]